MDIPLPPQSYPRKPNLKPHISNQTAGSILNSILTPPFDSKCEALNSVFLGTIEVEGVYPFLQPSWKKTRKSLYMNALVNLGGTVRILLTLITLGATGYGVWWFCSTRPDVKKT